jgi:L-ascorbate metabolism protein UlaG (beta-lactamase superfamily)
MGQGVAASPTARSFQPWHWLAALAALVLLAAGPARAACLPVAEGPGGIWQASLEPGEVELTFLGHASFLIRSPEGATAVTDYNDVHIPREPPDIATMNHAHRTHYSDRPDPRIKHVLRGWDPAGGVAVHDLDFQDMRVRNVPTNIRNWGGTRVAGNSIFVFEVGALCIAHLGHLHHTLTGMHLDELGVIDVLLVPVDGTYTLGQEDMIAVIEQIRPSLVIPMHYFSAQRLAGFLARFEGWEVRTGESARVVLSRLTLPYRQVLVLPGS